MTISLAFLAPDLVKAAIEGCLPRGICAGRVVPPTSDAGADWLMRPGLYHFLMPRQERVRERQRQ